MAKKRKSYRRGYKKGRRSQSKGGIMGYRLMDIGQGIYNVKELGYIDASQRLLAGDMEGAAVEVTDRLTDIPVMIGIATDNVMIGVTRKLLRKMGGKFVRKFIA